MQNIKAYIMLVCASLFWAGNFMVGKYAFLTEIPPLSLVFYRWSLVWIILLPFTYKEIIKHKDTILNNLPLLFFFFGTFKRSSIFAFSYSFADFHKLLPILSKNVSNLATSLSSMTL